MDNSLKTFNKNQQLQLWCERVKECRNSGIPVRTWCAENGIHPSTYYAWQKKLFNAAYAPATETVSSEIEKPVFEEISLETSGNSSEVLAATVVVGKTTVDIYSSISPELLQIIMRGIR